VKIETFIKKGVYSILLKKREKIPKEKKK